MALDEKNKKNSIDVIKEKVINIAMIARLITRSPRRVGRATRGESWMREGGGGQADGKS